MGRLAVSHLPDLPPLLVRLRLLAGRLVTRPGRRKGAHRAPRGAPRQFYRRPAQPAAPAAGDTLYDPDALCQGARVPGYAPANKWGEG